MANNGRLQYFQHFILKIKVVLEEPFVRAARHLASCHEHVGIVIDRNAVYMVDGSDEKLQLKVGEQLCNKDLR